MVNLTLERKYFRETYTIGRLSLNGEYFSDTLEDKTRDLNHDGDLDDPGEEKVYGETAIPYGRYKITVVKSPKFKRMLPYIHNVWGFEGILIHRGRYPIHTSGCVLVGKNKIKGGLVDSAIYEERLTAILLRAQENKEEIYINIV